jgi:nucleoid DNA-binding protein
MTKQQLIDRIAEATSHTRADVEKILESLIATIGETLKAGDKIELRGFGNFVIKETKARAGRNPRTGASLQIPAKRQATFKPGKELTESLEQRANAVGTGGVAE